MESRIELLIELSTFDEVGAWVPNHKDQIAGIVPEWCELVLELKRTEGSHPLNISVPMRRHDGELVIELLHDVLHPNAGGDAGSELWADMDSVVDRIQARVERGLEPRKSDVIKAQTLTRCIAVVTNPHDPDEDAIREMAMERYESRNPNAA